MEKGDGLLIFTDGVTEAMNPAKKLYTEARLEELLAGNEKAPEALTMQIFADVDRYAADAEQADDITILAYRSEVVAAAEEPDSLQLSITANLNEIDTVNREFSAFARDRGTGATRLGIC